MSTTSTTKTTGAAAAFSTPKAPIQWIVRPAQLDDAENVNRLLRKSYDALLVKDYEPAMLEIVLPKICNANEKLLTCGTWYVVQHPDDASHLVGCGGWTPESPPIPRPPEEEGLTFPHLRHFGTDPTCTRQGIAKQIWNQSWKDLLEHFEGQAQTMEVCSTLTAEAFYASLGFTKIRDMTIPFSEDCDFPCILMRREV